MDIMSDRLERVEANLNYTGKGPGLSRKLVSIHDGRAILDRLTLDQQGFVLREQEAGARSEEVCRRQMSGVFAPASCSRIIPMIGASLNRLARMRPSPLGDGL